MLLRVRPQIARQFRGLSRLFETDGVGSWTSEHDNLYFGYISTEVEKREIHELTTYPSFATGSSNFAITEIIYYDTTSHPFVSSDQSCGRQIHS